MMDGSDERGLRRAFYGVGLAAVLFYLLRELAPILRPLALAAFLAYVIAPLYTRWRQHLPRTAAILATVGTVMGVVYVLGLIVYVNAVELYNELPALTARGGELVERADRYAHDVLPPGGWERLFRPGAPLIDPGKVRGWALEFVNAVAGLLVETVAVGFLLVFVLIEAPRLPARVRAGLGPERAERFLAGAAAVNAALYGYVRVKLLASLALALPVTLVLWLCDVRFALLWGTLTFLGNFVPYLGSVAAWSLPVTFAFLTAAGPAAPVAAAALLLALHVASATAFEPALAARAVGLSPLVVLLGLAFWGLVWGLVGLLLAVPLTAAVKIVLDHVPGGAPVAALLGDSTDKDDEKAG
jgi:predicted PurR-regulated permease PerM